MIGLEDSTGPIWYRRWTRLDDPSNFFEDDSVLGGSFGLIKDSVCVFSVCEEEEAMVVVTEWWRKKMNKKTETKTKCGGGDIFSGGGGGE